VFGRRKNEPEVPPVPWDRVGRFTVGEVLRPGTLTRKPLTGPRAIRVPSTHDGVRYHAPSVLVSGTGSEAPSYELYDATRPTEPVCTLTPEKAGARYRVTDAGGAELGLVHRTLPARRTVEHGWWLQQPGHPDVVARYHWARGSAKEIATRGKENVVRGAGAVVGGVVDSVFSLGVDGDARTGSHRPRPVTWRAEGDEEPVVLTCEHLEDGKVYRPQASWLDLRLAFALAVLREA
jgi:hypothetical protein